MSDHQRDLTLVLGRRLTQGAVAKIGYVIPLAVFSTIFLAVASGLYSILEPGSPKGQWVGFQIIGGIGSGAGLQVVCPSPMKKYHQDK